jgi:heme exporter protein A
VSDPVIEARDVRRQFAGRTVLRGIDLGVRPGEVVALLGPNGAGKTTLLRVLAGLLRPTAGEVRVRGRLDPRERAARASIGFVGHESGCYLDLTGWENLVFHAELRRIPDAALRVAELLAWTTLGEAGDRPARTYSRGMLQRLALARALLHAPDVLLLDEPFTGLDPTGAGALARLLGELARAGHAVVMSVHDVGPVVGVVTRAAIMHRGRLEWIEDGPAGDPLVVAAAWRRVVIRS